MNILVILVFCIRYYQLISKTDIKQMRPELLRLPKCILIKREKWHRQSTVDERFLVKQKLM